jgi:YaiO family outer membrane protein
VHIQALLGLGDAKSTDEARALRLAAQKRFPRRDWTFAVLDATAPASATPPETAATASPLPSPPPPASTASAAASTPVVSPPTSPAPLEASARIEVELNTTQERLTKGLPNWTTNAIFLSWRDAERRSWYGGWRDVRRYNLNDTDAHVGTVQPLGNDFSLQGEVGGSGSHRFLARSYAQLVMHKSFGTDWMTSVGWKESHFDAGRTVLGTFAVERTLRSYRVGYTLYEGRPDGAGFSPSHRLHLSRDYGDRNVMTVSLIDGRETEASGNGRFLTSPISGLSVSGKHWFTPDWALSWDVIQQKQGDLYTRKGVTLGIRRAF